MLQIDDWRTKSIFSIRLLGVQCACVWWFNLYSQNDNFSIQLYGNWNETKKFQRKKKSDKILFFSSPNQNAMTQICRVHLNSLWAVERMKMACQPQSIQKPVKPHAHTSNYSLIVF